MPRLVVNPGSPQAWEIQLKPGTNHLGRGITNDFKVDDLSVSGSHCQIVVQNGAAIITDLGSTNGTFVNRSPVREARLEAGQVVRLGSVDMMFYSDGDTAVEVRSPAQSIVSVAAPLPPTAPPLPAVAVAATRPVLATIGVAAAPAPVMAATPTHALVASATLAPPTLQPPPAAVLTPARAQTPGTELLEIDGPRTCKFHPKSLARFFCPKCRRGYCDLCVTTINTPTASHKNCRHCGGECAPMKVRALESDLPKNFFKMIPDAFAYPVRGVGVIVLLLGMVVFTGLRWGGMLMGAGVHARSARGMTMGLLMTVVLGGYLFTFIQSIIHATASGDRELSDLPGMPNFLDDIVLPFFRLLGLTLFSFGPAIAFIVWRLTGGPLLAANAIIPALIVGSLYFPMAFLAVATLDSLGAVNPLVIIPSIMKVPLEYAIAPVMTMTVLGFIQTGDILVGFLFPKGMLTHSIPELFAMFGLKFVWSLVSLYLLAVTARMLGTLYLTKKDTLGWLQR